MPDEFLSAHVDTLQAIIDHSDDGIVVVDERGFVIEWNHKLATITGIPRSAALGRAIWDLQLQSAPPGKNTPANLAAIKHQTLRMLSSGEVPHGNTFFEQIIQRSDGALRLIQSLPVPVPTERGYLLVSTVRDVTDWRRLEDELRRSEARYRMLFEQANDAIMLENEADEIIDANQRAAELTGYTREELLRLHVSDLQAPEVRGQSGRVVADELARHAGQPFESIDLRHDGSRVPIEITETRLSGLDDGLVLTIIRDITERKRVEQALRENEERFRLAFQAAAIGKALVATNGRFLRVNSALCQMLAYTEEELLARTFNAVTYPADVSIGQDYFRRILAGELDSASFEKRYVRRDGTPIWVIVSSSLIRDAQGQPSHFISEMQDISERKRAELALRDSEEKYRQLFELESDAIFLVDNVTGQIFEANSAATALYGCTHDELLNLHNTDLSAEPERTRQAMAEQHQLIPTRWHRRRDGSIFPVEITARHLVWHDRPVHIAAIRDITARQRAEQALQDRNRDLADLNAELQTRNEDLDAFAHTVAHDLKNPLHLVVGFAETLVEADETLTLAEQTGALRNIARNARKMNNIIDELLLLAEVRKTQMVPRPLDLARILADAQQRLTDMIDDSQAEISVPATWPVVMGYAPWVEEVWVNYLSNALKYGGQPPRVKLGAELLLDGMVRLWVRDNGLGLSPEEQARLFTPFARLDQVRARGHGLGLSIVRRIVEKMGGQVGVVSVGLPETGSLFYFTLPPID
ncbi:MAG TPA: PAS domain S-box protein [Anaerolineae bacterium]|nr:PAS domain S-box protein [Anaerolineae bacterium]